MKMQLLFLSEERQTQRPRMFNETKATQAAARLLKKTGGAMNYMVLIKMLYLADRAALLKWGRPITGDEYFTMKLGPVLSQVHDLITEMQPPEEEHPWTKSISKDKWDVSLQADAGDSELSEAEERLLDAIFERFKNYLNDPFGLPKWIHANLQEVKTVETGRIPLEIREILQAGERPEEEIEKVIDELAMLDKLDSLLVKA